MEQKDAQFRMRRIVWIAFLILMLVSGGAVLLGLRLDREPGPAAGARIVVIPHGGLEAVAGALSSAGVVADPLTFRLAALASFWEGSIHAAEFRFPAHASLAMVLEVLRHSRPVQHRVTIAEGLEAAQIAQLFARQGGLLDGDLAVGAEGALLPETYSFERGTSFAVLAARARQAMARELASAWESRAGGLPLRSAAEALVLASIVEHEARLPAERPMIARVFLNRMAVGMRLQADPTAAYGASGGLGFLGRKLDRDDLARDDPYNTYVVSGLPAGPICSPGLASLAAVLHPAGGDALYFVADGTGGHLFAASLGQHSVNVARYRARVGAGGAR